jgi:hypothetical protein
MLACALRHNDSNFRRMLSLPSMVRTNESGIASIALCESHPRPDFTCSSVAACNRDSTRGREYRAAPLFGTFNAAAFCNQQAHTTTTNRLFILPSGAPEVLMT